MAQVMQIHKVDNGYFIQTVEKEGSPLEGISIANNMTEVEALVHAKLVEIEGVQKAVEKSEGPPIELYPGSANQQQRPPADDLVEPPLLLDDYEAELRRLVEDNDRDAAHARLKVHVDAGRIEPYKPRLGVKNLVDLIRQGDKATASAGAEKETETTTSGGTLPSGAPLPDGVPPPTGHDPFAATEEVTVQDVSAALQAAAKRTDSATAFGVLKALGATKVTDLTPEQYAGAIANANAL